jgi:hypothetical protein
VTGPPAVQELVRLLHPDRANRRLARLSRRARRRYEERVTEIAARVKRELEEFQAVLEAEHRPGRHPRQAPRDPRTS